MSREPSDFEAPHDHVIKHNIDRGQLNACSRDTCSITPRASPSFADTYEVEAV